MEEEEREANNENYQEQTNKIQRRKLVLTILLHFFSYSCSSVSVSKPIKFERNCNLKIAAAAAAQNGTGNLSRSINNDRTTLWKVHGLIFMMLGTARADLLSNLVLVLDSDVVVTWLSSQQRALIWISITAHSSMQHADFLILHVNSTLSSCNKHWDMVSELGRARKLWTSLRCLGRMYMRVKIENAEGEEFQFNLFLRAQACTINIR